MHRMLLEFVGPGPEGGRYVCPLGAVEQRAVVFPDKQTIARFIPALALVIGIEHRADTHP